MLNVYEQVDANKRRSAIIIACFVLFVIAFVWVVGQVLGSDPSMVIFAAIFSLASSFTSYYWGDKIILTISGAKPANRDDFFDFYTVAENLALAAQIPIPKLYVIKSPAMNAFATGRDPKHAIICTTTGLLEKLDRSELEGVVAHEISHITNFDIRVMMIVAVLVGMVTLLSDWLMRMLWYRGGEREERKQGNALVMLVGIITLIVSPLIAKLIQLAISRRRESLADASAVKMTRFPQGLISALEKLATSNIPLVSANQATAHLYIINPFKGMKKGFHSFAILFATHPPIEDRIATLKKMI